MEHRCCCCCLVMDCSVPSCLRRWLLSVSSLALRLCCTCIVCLFLHGQAPVRLIRQHDLPSLGSWCCNHGRRPLELDRYRWYEVYCAQIGTDVETQQTQNTSAQHNNNKRSRLYSIPIDHGYISNGQSFCVRMVCFLGKIDNQPS